MVWREVCCVVQRDVMCRESTALVGVMCHQIEVHPEKKKKQQLGVRIVTQPPAGSHHEYTWPVSVSEGVIQNSSRWSRAKRVGTTGVQGGVDALLDHDEDQLGFVAGESFKAFDQLRDLVLLHHPQLTVWHTVPVHHNLLGQVVVHLHKTTQGEGVMCVNYKRSFDWLSCWSPTHTACCSTDSPLFSNNI